MILSIKRIAILVFLLLLISSSQAGAGQEAVPSQLGGKPFDDPDVVQEMSKEWQAGSIEYQPGTGPADLVVSINQQFEPFMGPLIEQYAREQGVKVVVQIGTCGITAGALTKKNVDMAGFCCPPAKSDRFPGLRFHTIGIHPIAILVHPDNPINDLSFAQIRKIFMGEFTLWSELGWQDMPIQTIGRLHCKKRPGHWRLLLDNEDLFSPSLREVGAINDMLSLVATVPGSIGYEVLMTSSPWQVKSLKINGHAPGELENLLDGTYPLYRVMSMTTWEAPHLKNPLADKLIAYLIAKAETMGREYNVVPVSSLKKAGWKFKDNELVGLPE